MPVLEFKMERGHMETKNAEIALVSIDVYKRQGKTYQLLSSAYSMVKEADYHAADGLKPIIDRYLAADYNMDQQYRRCV